MRDDRNPTFGNVISVVFPSIGKSLVISPRPLVSLRVQLVAHAVLDVVVDDEVKLLFRETIMLR